MTITVVVDGVGKLEFPDNTDHQVIRSTVQNLVAKNGKQTPSLGVQEPTQSTGNWLFSSALHGGLDTAGGVAQIVSHAADAMGMPKGTNMPLLASPEIVNQSITDARQDVTSRFGDPGAVPRGISSAALTLPLTPLKFIQAPTLVGRSVGAGVAGGIGAGLQEIPGDNSNGDFLKKKAVQTGFGGAAGLLTQPIGELAVGAGTSLVNMLGDKAITAGRNITGANSTDKLVTLVRESLKKNGLDFDALSDHTKQALVDDVAKATAQYSGTNPGAIARQAAFREAGFDPLRHWITRNPAEFTYNENLAGVQGVGDPLKQRMNDLDSFITQRFNAMRGAPKTDAHTTGSNVQRDLKDYLDQQEGKTNVLYDTFREIAPDVKGDSQRLVNDVFGGLEGKMAGASLPPGLREIVNGISKGEIPATPSTLHQLQKMANGAYQGADGSTRMALGHLSAAIDREMNAISAGFSGDSSRTAEVLKMARGQHAKVQGELESTPALQAIKDGNAEPERFFRGLESGSVKDLANTWIKLNEDSKAEIRARMVDYLKSKAFGSASDDAGKAAAQASFNNYLAGDGVEQKLKIILGDKGWQEAKRMGMMMEAAHMQPSGSKVNNSNTAPAVLSMGTRLSDSMVRAGIMGGRPLQAITRGANADIAAQSGADALGSQSVVIRPEIEEMLKRLTGGLLSVPAGAAAGTYGGLLSR